MEVGESKIQEYIEAKKDLYTNLIDYIESEDETLNTELINKLNQIKESETIEDKELLFNMIISISNNHHRHFQFLKKIEELIKYLGNTLKQMMTNSEIFDFFKKNKLIILYLLKNQILEIEEPIFDRIKYQKTYLRFFYPEIKLFLSEEEQSATEKEMKLTNENVFEKFERKRDTGENDDYICSLIRSDSVVEFITHVNQTCAPLSSKIKRSIFETNSFLIDQEPTMLEYAAFFGSVQIF